MFDVQKQHLPSLEDNTDGVARGSLVETPQSARKKCSSEICMAIRKHAQRTLYLRELPAWEGLHLPVARDICFCKSKPFYFSQLRFLSLPVQFPLCHTCPFVRWQWRNQRHFWGLAIWSCVEIHPDYGLGTYLCLWLDALLPVVFLGKKKDCREQSIKDWKWMECSEPNFRPPWLDEVFYRMQWKLPVLRMGEAGKKVKSVLHHITK